MIPKSSFLSCPLYFFGQGFYRFGVQLRYDALSGSRFECFACSGGYRPALCGNFPVLGGGAGFLLFGNFSRRSLSVDVVGVMTEQPDYQVARNYWKVLKHRLVKEGNQTVTNCNQLKMVAPDGKMRLTDVADIEQLFRLVQSIPSPKAEPFKLWLAQLWRERLEEIDDPEMGIERMMEFYHRKGYSES